MNPSAVPSSNCAPADQDLAEQARPGYGIPSQDPRPAAQMPMEPEEAEREAKSVLMGGGVMAGAATGAAIGTAVAGPVGAVVGGTLGAVAGALGGAAAGSAVNLEAARNAATATAAADAARLHIEGSGGGGRPLYRRSEVRPVAAPPGTTHPSSRA